MKRILITGASQGIGRETALQLARRGHRVVLAARDEAALHALARQIAQEGGAAEVLPMDVTSDAGVEAAVAAMLARGPCDVVVNNAGTCCQEEFLLQEPATRRAEMELNYWGPQRVARAVLPSMLHRRGGAIVNVSSLVSVVAAPTTANYSASKAALNAWSQALRGEVSRFGVEVVLFVAPHTQTALGERSIFDGVHSLPVSYTAKELVYAIERRPRFYAASPVYRLLLRLAAWFPRFMEGRIAASTRRLLSADPLHRLGEAERRAQSIPGTATHSPVHRAVQTLRGEHG